ncbi:hypothetical protein [Alienimonas californiensis]|uniref:Uncharacterized protein n=1 Tax=Alienimonas californiensis TaxID=2527989 RepID=A0A517PBM4_9PLAN|nr:hypothetical protein [Alienimonas californiensis]QDT16783.1 hypothetical protein CA12_28900 [Alienimonas californiensis]
MPPDDHRGGEFNWSEAVRRRDELRRDVLANLSEPARQLLGIATQAEWEHRHLQSNAAYKLIEGKLTNTVRNLATPANDEGADT